MKKAILAYQYGMENAGDFAINLGSLDLLNEFYDEIVVVSKLTADDKEFDINRNYLLKYYDNIEVIGGPFKLNRSNKVKLLKNYFTGLLKYPFFISRGIYKDKIKNSNTLYLNGGNLLRCESFTDFVRLVALVFPLVLANRSKKKFILLPQSTTVLNNSGKTLLNSYINKAEIVSAREEISKNKLVKYFPEANIIHSLDSAFYIKDRENVEKDYSNKYYFLKSIEGNVCITLRKEDIGDIGELSEEKKKRIRGTIEALIKSLLNNGNHITFVIQTKKDKIFTEAFYKKFSSYDQILLVEEYDPLILREIYRNSICLIGMRLHSLILAMSVGTPVVGYFETKWGIKNPGTLKQYDMPYGFIEDDPDLYLLLTKAQSYRSKMINGLEKSKNKYREVLRKEVGL